MKTQLRAAGLACLLFAATLQCAPAGQLRAGAAKVSITPPRDEFPFPFDATRGCAPRFEPGKSCDFVGVHDDIFARAIVLSDGQQSVAIVLVESENVPDAADLKAAIAEALRIPQANVLLAASHTHDVPLVTYHTGTPSAAQKSQIDRLKAGAIEAARGAMATLTNARSVFGRGAAWVNVNNGDHIGANGYDPHGPSDHTLDVIKLEDVSGKAIALFINYASHAEVMYRSVTNNGGYEVSGDLPGFVSRTLESLPVGAPVVLFSAAAEGDQLPLFKSKQVGTANLPAADEGAAGYALLNVLGRRLTASVIDVLGAMPAGTSQAIIGATAGSTTCPGQKMHVDPNSGKVLTDPAGPVTIPLGVIRLNDIALAGVGADVGTDIGLAVKNASPVAHTTLVSMTAGSVGYVLADSSYTSSSHGVIASPLQPHCAEKAISEGLRDMTASLWK